MRTHGIASRVLMLLVVWAAGCAAPKEASPAQTAAATPETVLPSTDIAAVGNTPIPQRTSPQTEPAHPFKVVAYYFHRSIRCPSCLRIEEYAKNAVESMFPQEIAGDEAGLATAKNLGRRVAQIALRLTTPAAG